MTKKSIIDNCHRLLFFYNQSRSLDESAMKVEEWIGQRGASCESLLQLYGAILDSNGAFKTGLSILFLPEEEYKELRQYCYNKEGFVEHDQCISRPTAYMFFNDGYQFFVRKNEI